MAVQEQPASILEAKHCHSPTSYFCIRGMYENGAMGIPRSSVGGEAKAALSHVGHLSKYSLDGAVLLLSCYTFAFMLKVVLTSNILAKH